MTPTTPRAIALLAWIASILPGAHAIYKDDAGVLDFSVATAGHGAFEWARSVSDADLLITTDVPRAHSRSSCFVAGRSLSTGTLRWRRNVCSVLDPETQAHGIAMGTSVSSSEAFFYTVDNAGVVRAWTVANGDLLWDAKVAPAVSTNGSKKKPRVFAVNEGTVAVASGESELVLLDASTGSLADTIRVDGSGSGSGSVDFFSVKATSESSLSFAMARAAAGDDTFAGNDFLVGSYERGGKVKVGAGGLSGSAKAVVADSVRVIGDDVWAVTAVGEVVQNGRVLPASSWVGDWDRVLAVKATTDPSVVALSGTSGGTQGDQEEQATMVLFRKDDVTSSSSSQWKRIHTGKASAAASAAAYSPKGGWILETPPGQSARLFDATSGAPLPVAGAAFGADGDSVTIATVLEESATSSTVLIGTERGTTTVLEVSSSSSSSSSKDIRMLWTAEEGLSSISSAIILDASHMGSDDLVEEQDEVAYRLSLAGRWKAQWQELSEILTTANGLIGSNSKKYRDHLFGFLKVSAMLSSKSHRLWGMSTAGDDRGAIRWSLDLPKAAVWHSMVHGTTNAARAAHGIHGDTHSREILVLSALRDRVEWMCIDGTSGAVNARDSVAVVAGSSIAQVVPVYGPSTGGCRQAALLLGEDLSLTTVPGDGPTTALVQKQLHKTPNGLYTHKIDKVSNTVQSYRVAAASSSSSSSSSSSLGSLAALPVGMASFDGEQIVRVAYPLRHEDMQSMSTILGDNSLLLKYINPHMAVVVTVVKDPDQQSETEVAKALGLESSSKPRKPVGAGAPGSSTAPASGLPNMFVNLVDTVSGRVLYRHGHSNVETSKTVSVVVSENWVVYSYVNDKTRRTEIGVLTLHEGMIEPKGLTYFSRPEQSSSFSSFDSRQSKPVVLSKVYAYPKAVTALGVTQTKQGISRQNILLASADGALITLNKMILETRRPVGDAKPDEKKEGLVPYRELIPNTPLISLNYNRTMEPFSSIVSATTALESQSLVFGFGGPDLFFARTSPTKGFDLLPETFNKGLVGMTTVGIVVALFAVQRMGEKKVLKQSWL